MLGTVKALVVAAQGDNPSTYVAATAEVATTAHPMVLLAEDIAADTRIEPERKLHVERCGEQVQPQHCAVGEWRSQPLDWPHALQVMDSIKSIVAAAKNAAKLHPSQEALEQLKDTAKALLLCVKEFTAALQLPTTLNFSVSA